MKAISGYLENGLFTPQEFIKLPRRVQVVLVYNEAAADDDHTEHIDWLQEFHRMAAESANENDVFNDEAFARRPSGRELVTLSDEGDA